MSHIYKVSAWKASSGRWYCNDVSDLSGTSGYWWVPCRILNISPSDFVLLIKFRFHAEVAYNAENGFLHYFWSQEREKDCKAYMKFINSFAVKTQSYI